MLPKCVEQVDILVLMKWKSAILSAKWTDSDTLQPVKGMEYFGTFNISLKSSQVVVLKPWSFIYLFVYLELNTKLGEEFMY